MTQAERQKACRAGMQDGRVVVLIELSQDTIDLLQALDRRLLCVNPGAKWVSFAV